MPKIIEILFYTMKNFRPDLEMKNPVMFVTEISLFVSIFVTIFPELFGLPFTTVYRQFYVAVCVLLFLTLFFSNVSSAVSEGRSKAITESLKKFKQDSVAHLVFDETVTDVVSSALKKGDIIRIERDENVPIDGEVIKGSGYVNEANITGESRPVLKIMGDSVTGSTRLLTDQIMVRVTTNPGETFIDSMIKMVQSSSRERTPTEISLSVLLSGITLIFLITSAGIFSLSEFLHIGVNLIVLIVLLIALIPTTIGGLLPAIGIAAINKVSAFNIIAKSGKAVENAGDIDTIILDKTGTVTMGDREATKFYPNKGTGYQEFLKMCAMASLLDETKEGMSVLKLAKMEGTQVDENDISDYEFLPFSAETKFSGIRREEDYVIKGALRALMKKFEISDTFVEALCKEISLRGGTALPVVRNGEFVGVIELNDILKPGIKERLSSLKNMNIKTIMCTGDDEITASYIAEESGIDEYVANSTPVDKYNVVINEKNKQRMVAMVGDGTNDAPALSKADVGMAMNNGTPAAKEAANMVDLDNDPTKLMDVIFIGKQILITRGSLTSFSIANDLSKYFVIIPAIFCIYPQLSFINILGLSNPLVAVTSALIFNTIIIVALIPMALRGVRFRPITVEDLLRRNILIYGLGGIIAPFIAIKIIYVILSVMGVMW